MKERSVQESIERMKKVLPIIAKVKQSHSGEDWKGTETCPVCFGVLFLTHSSYNGHVWGKCETKDCLSWME